MSDQIILNGIQIMAHVGVPDEERAKPQRVEVSATLHLDLRQAARSEQLSMSRDYAEIYSKILEVVQQRPRRLIETMAEDVAEALLQVFKVERVEVEVCKFILENTRSVAVRIMRRKKGNKKS